MKAKTRAKTLRTMTDAPQTLDDIRRDIDEIDGKLLGLLAARFAATARVKAAKGGALNGSPMRPAREATVLRRICEEDAAGEPLPLRAAIWRNIIASSTLAQAPVRIHVAAGLFNSAEARLMIRDHFGATPVVSHAGEDAALMALGGSAVDISVMAFGGTWAMPLAEGKAGRVAVSGVLPFINGGAAPTLAILSHASAEPTGADETLLATNGQLPRDFAPAPLWQIQQGRLRLSCIPGFLDEHASPLLGLARANGTLGLKVLGRYPSPIES